MTGDEFDQAQRTPADVPETDGARIAKALERIAAAGERQCDLLAKQLEQSEAMSGAMSSLGMIAQGPPR